VKNAGPERSVRARVLLADDDPAVADLLLPALSQAGFEVTLTKNGSDTLAVLRNEPIEVVLLDIQMPPINGDEVLRRLREEHNAVIVVMLTQVTSDGSIIDCFNSGTDDYICKPLFDPWVLVARIRAVLRRADRGEAGLRYAIHLWSEELHFDVPAQEVTRAQPPVKLSHLAKRLLRCLMMAPRQRFERDQLIRLVWNYEPQGNDPGEARAVEQRIGELRRGLGESAAEPHFIATSDGLYSFDEPVQGFK